MIPGSYQAASWRNTTLPDGVGNIGIGLDTRTGPHRYILDAESARYLRDTLAEALAAYDGLIDSHPSRSYGMPKSDGSPQEGQKV